MSDLAFAGRDEFEALWSEIEQAWAPPPKLTLSEWADEYFRLSAESSADIGRWKTLPYQRGIMDALTDPDLEQVWVMKSARVGWTKMLNAWVGYSIHQDPCPFLLVQPDLEAARGYSTEEIAPMLRDVPVLSRIIFEDSEDKGPRAGGNKMLHKRFPGGVLSLAGAQSGAGFRRISRKRVGFDEVDAYPPSAGSDGDPVRLGIKRTEYFWDRKIAGGSTPLVAGNSRIEALFQAGDQRRYYVPCPGCGHMDFLVFTERPGGGHFMVFDPDAPEGAHFVCARHGCVIEHQHKREMMERGEWRAARPGGRIASFHIWAAYSYSPNSTWADLAREFLTAKREGAESLRTFVNTVLGESWKERGDAPEWERLFNRREPYPLGIVPAGVRFLTAGVDVQKDRWVYEVVGWSGREKESWSIDAGVIPGNPANEADWLRLDEFLERLYESAGGGTMQVMMLGIDSGYNAQMVYNWGRRHERTRVAATKGVAGQRTIINKPTTVDVDFNGKRLARGYRVWPIGVDVAKAEFYGWLRLPQPTDGMPPPPGYCHFPAYDEEYFRQITAEHLVTTTNKRTRRQRHEWHVLPGRENHWLDARLIARAAAAILGVDRLTPLPPAPPRPAPQAATSPGASLSAPPTAPTATEVTRERSSPHGAGFLGGRGRGWLRR